MGPKLSNAMKPAEQVVKDMHHDRQPDDLR